MTGKKKYFLGLGVILLLIVSSIFYSKNQFGKDIVGQGTNEESNIDMIQQEETLSKAEGNAEAAQNIEAADVKAAALQSSSEPNTTINQEIKDEIAVLVNKYYDISKDYDTDILTSNTKEEKEKRTELLTKKKEIIEKYENIQNYIKPGLSENTYIVYTTYDMKIFNIDTLVPGMSVLVISKDDMGKLRIKNTQNEDDLNAYISQLSSEDEIKAIIEKINKDLSDTIKKDASLEKFIKYLKEIA